MLVIKLYYKLMYIYDNWSPLIVFDHIWLYMLCHFLYFPDASVIAFLLQFHHVETDPKRIPLLWWLFISLRKQRKLEPLFERQCSREQKKMGEIQKPNESKFQLGCLMMISVIILLSISFNVPSIMWQNCPNWCENSDWNDWKSYWSYWIHSEKSCFEMGRKWFLCWSKHI